MPIDPYGETPGLGLLEFLVAAYAVWLVAAAGVAAWPVLAAAIGAARSAGLAGAADVAASGSGGAWAVCRWILAAAAGVTLVASEIICEI